MKIISIVVPKVWQLLPKLHLIGNCCQLAQLVSRGFEKTSPTYKQLGHLLSRPYLLLSGQFCFKQKQRVKTFATALYIHTSCIFYYSISQKTRGKIFNSGGGTLHNLPTVRRHKFNKKKLFSTDVEKSYEVSPSKSCRDQDIIL